MANIEKIKKATQSTLEEERRELQRHNEYSGPEKRPLFREAGAPDA